MTHNFREEVFGEKLKSVLITWLSLALFPLADWGRVGICSLKVDPAFV